MHFKSSGRGDARQDRRHGIRFGNQKDTLNTVGLRTGVENIFSACLYKNGAGLPSNQAGVEDA